ncbi:hypothetical protein tb265_17660 [Gemmatimonadetes bacterium T265]|nr:hypothetical protein tb265_17660 [Gemmatimonadetes bacterium T265]
MSAPSQKHRPFAVRTPLGDDALLLERFEGEEGVSRPFRFSLDLLSPDPCVNAERLLGQPASLVMALEDDAERVLHARVSRFAQLGARDGMTAYRAELVPWLWFLSLGSDCRVFQHRSVPEIVEQVFKELPFAKFESRLLGSYAPREYCVQYRETHLAFVSRLLEEEGIYYFFRHEPNQHTLVLADAPSAARPAWGKTTASMTPAGGTWHEDRVIEAWREHAVQPGRVTLTSYDYLKPSHALLSTVGDGGAEVHDYAADFLEHAEGDRYARLRLEAREALRQVVYGRSACRAFQSGASFELRDHYRPDFNGAYQLLSVRHAGANGSYGGGDDTPAAYSNAFEAVPGGVPYRPPCATPRPFIYGTQSAVVVGKAGEEIWTDAHGRVKLHFHWDRHGKRDENSSCWVRVSTAWAGKGWGQFSVPRIGQEVLVEFLDGDPDRPVVVGRVYNAEQTPPCNPGAGGVVSGMRSKTHKGGGYNAMEMDDTAGKEQIAVHAQHDMGTTVLHDYALSVGNDRQETIAKNRTKKVGVNESVTIGANRTEQVGADESIAVIGSRTRSVGGSETVKVARSRTHSVAINEAINVGAAQEVSVGGLRAVTVGAVQTITVGAAQMITVGGPQMITVGRSQKTTIGGSHAEKVAANRTLAAGGKIGAKARGSVTIVSSDQIVLKAGAASLTLKKDGTVLLKGKDVTVKGSGDVTHKAGGNVTIKGSKIAEN